MNTQNIFNGARLASVRELKAEVEKLKGRCNELTDENQSLRAHFASALIALADLKDAGDTCRSEIWDGWNLILGDRKAAFSRDELASLARKSIRESDGNTRVWIVFDGADEKITNESGLRVSYTGGHGSQRADRFICDFVRAAAYLGLARKLTVRTNDRKFANEVRRLGAKIESFHKETKGEK